MPRQARPLILSGSFLKPPQPPPNSASGLDFREWKGQRPELPGLLVGRVSCKPLLAGHLLPQAPRSLSLWEEGGVCPLEEQDLT